MKHRIDETIETNLDKINSVESYICNILENENFDRLNYLQARRSANTALFINRETNRLQEAEFVAIDADSIAPYSNLITEKEFFKIVGKTKNGVSKKSGLYQEKLYARYLEAKQEDDKGYIEDVLRKAIVFSYNIEYIKHLMEDKKFMKEWRRNYGKETPLSNYKHYGNLRNINTIKSLIM